ncbi:MAG TPA: glycoside hydrolase 43 family protein [Firmicutes bacterium]|jgi:xylan 1,4-beta-xylosidase|nr:glycoside hydrolase 43 family protein [Bacillota bacterium]
MKMIHNPILRGFNPDPSVLRVGDDYYIATSTFEWFPGVQIHHSRDLIHWQLIVRPLNRLSQLNMTGNPNSGGIWAPCLSYANGIYYLIYTDVKSFSGIFRDTHNYLLTTTDIRGDWSDPVYLNSSGFDPSLFHDNDGRKWLLNMVTDHRQGKKVHAGILLQEYSPAEKSLVGPVYKIFSGTELDYVEAPHLYKKNGYYYLITAEGGTGLGHAVTLARSKSLTGPYDLAPGNPILTSKDDSILPLQKAGHASLVETQTGEWYMVHLCGRPLPARGRFNLGRETGIQKVVWTEDGWLTLATGGNHPTLETVAPDLPEYRFQPQPDRDDFESPDLNIHLQTLRIPLNEEFMTLKERPGFLRLRGSESLSSKHHQTLVARRQQAFCYTATTCLEFDPQNHQQMAGLICFYNTDNFYYLRVTHNEEQGKCLGIIANDCNKFSEPLTRDYAIKEWQRCYLRAKVDYDRLQFYFAKDETSWQPIGPVLDASTLSDENSLFGWAFTGAFVGLCCQDLSGRRRYADFDFFTYEERNS